MVQLKAPHRNWSPALRHVDLFDGMELPEPPTLFDDYANRSSVLGEHAMGIYDHMYWGWDMKFEGPNLFPEHFLNGIPNREFQRLSKEDQKVHFAAYNDENQKFIDDMKAGKLDKAAIDEIVDIIDEVAKRIERI